LINGVSDGIYAVTTALTRIFGTLTTPAATDATYIVVNAASGNTNGIYRRNWKPAVSTRLYPHYHSNRLHAADSYSTVPAGINQLRFTFDDSTRAVAVSPAATPYPPPWRGPISKASRAVCVRLHERIAASGDDVHAASIGTYTNAAGVDYGWE
jgi:hypothetical protein